MNYFDVQLITLLIYNCRQHCFNLIVISQFIYIQKQSMISSGINKKQSQIVNANKSNKTIVTMHYQQKSVIKNYLVSRPINVMMKNSQSDFIDKRRQQLKVNDENCSYNGNVINHNGGFEGQATHCKRENIDKQNNQGLNDAPTANIISLKKKIKKCQHPLTSYNSFREKVTFRKKLHQRPSPQQQIKSSQIEQTFYVFRESEVFTSLRSRELLGRTVVQRMDNDTETDEEQVQGFVKRMVGDFVEHVQKVRSKNLLIVSQKKHSIQHLQSPQQPQQSQTS